MPTFNSEDTIATALASIESQSITNFELVIIDNLSTDRTLALAKSSNVKNMRIISESDTGIYEALNKGISEAKGHYITILHSTDYYGSTECLSSALSLIESDKIDFCFGVVKIFDTRTKRVLRELNYPNFKKNWIRLGYMPPHPTILLRRSLIEKMDLRYDETYEICGDFEFIIRLFNIPNIRYAFCKNLCIYMDNQGKSSLKVRNFIKMNREIYRAFYYHGTPFWFFTSLFRYFSKTYELRFSTYDKKDKNEKKSSN